jgi:beta-glucosidase/6-phospho-beta-glucosidase/beta-galactosidase
MSVPGTPLFQSFFSGGFECSTHRRADNRRLDLVAATAHDAHVVADYRRLRELGIRTVREGIRWHLIEPAPGRYDFSTVRPVLVAARELGVQVIWDLCHYGWPDDLDIFSPAFVDRFARLAHAFARLLASETDDVPFLCPINEISFLAWAGGEMGFLNPFGLARGHELKAQLIRAAIAAIEAIWEIDRRARICHVDPVFHVIPDPSRPEDAPAAEAFRLAQYQGWDMLAGRQRPELGGRPAYLDIIGVNYYAYNQWTYVDDRDGGPTIPRTHPAYRPFREILAEVYARYGRPLFVAETGAEGEARADWLRYVGSETRAARDAGVAVHGICLYPIVNFPGWDDDRHCLNGLWDYADARGERELHGPLADELRRQQALLEASTEPRASWI